MLLLLFPVCSGQQEGIVVNHQQYLGWPRLINTKSGLCVPTDELVQLKVLKNLTLVLMSQYVTVHHSCKAVLRVKGGPIQYY